MFRDRKQANRAARVLLGEMELDHLWDEDGATERAEELIAEDGGSLSSREAALLLATDVLCGKGTPQPRELTLRAFLRDLKGPPMGVFLTLLFALETSPEMVDATVAGYEDRLRARRRSSASPAPPAEELPPTKASPQRSRAELRNALSAALLGLERPQSFRIPILDVVRRLEAENWPRAAIHEELRAMDRGGELQLYPATNSELAPEQVEALPKAYKGAVYLEGFRTIRWRDPCGRCGLMAQAPVHDDGAIGESAHAFVPKPSVSRREGCS
jgi:hypothetical protein